MALETVGVRAVVEDFGLYISRSQQVSAATLAMGTAAQKAGTLGSGLTSFLKSATLLGAGLTAALGGLSLKGASEFSTTLAKIDALTNTTAEDTQRLGKGLLNLAKVVPKSPNELGAAAYFALSSGITDVNEALKLVTAASKASAAGLGSTADIVDIVTAAVNAYGPANLDAAHAVDVLVATVREGKGEPAAMATALGSLLPLAAALKIPFEEVAATFASLTNSLGGGGAAEQAATQFKGIMSQIISPSKEAKDALAEQEAGVKHLSKEELELADAHKAVVSASDNLASAQRGVRDAAEGVTQAQRGVRDAQQGVADAQRSSRSATEALRNAYADLTQAQRNQQQASLDGRRETLSVLEAEQGLAELRTQAGAHGLELAAAELALSQARETASSKDKKTANEQRAAALAVQQAELRLNQVRAQGGRFSLDLQNAELRLADTRARVGTAQKQQDKAVADAQKNIEKNTQAVADAHRNEIKAREGVTDATKNLNRAYEGQEDAQRGVARAGTDLALAQEKEILAVIHTRDAFKDLRKEIADGSFRAALQRIVDLFKGNEEGLAKLFPDIRGLIGVLAAYESQGEQTKGILERIKNSAGITEEAFQRMSKEISFQAALLKNTFNVALIELGTVALPYVNRALQESVKWLLQASEFFKKGLDGTKIGGDFSALEKASFKAGENIRNMIQFIKDNKDATLLPVGKSFIEGLKDVAQWFIDHKEAILLAFAVFSATNPLWAGILAGGVIITAIGVLGQDIDGLSDPLLRVRRQIDLTIQRMADLANTFFSLGLNKIPGVKDLIPTVVSSKGADQDLKDVDAEIARRAQARAELAEATRQLAQDQALALQQGIPYEAFLRKQIEDYIALAGGISSNDEFIRRLIERYGQLPGADKGALEIFKTALHDGDQAAIDLANSLSKIKPPDVGDAGLQTITNATDAAATEGQTIDGIEPPDVGDAGKAVIDDATRAAGGLGATLGKITRPNVGDAGLGSIAAAAQAALSLASNLARAALEASRISAGAAFGGAASRRAEGGVVRRPEFALVGEAGPEAILPLSDPARSLQILSALPPALVKAITPTRLADGGIFGESQQIASKWMPHLLTATQEDWNRYFHQETQRLFDQYFGRHIKRGLDQGTSGGGGGGGESASAPIALRQSLASISPALVASMSSRAGAGVVNVTTNVTGGTLDQLQAFARAEATRSIDVAFSRARTQSAIGGGLVTSGIG